MTLRQMRLVMYSPSKAPNLSQEKSKFKTANYSKLPPASSGLVVGLDHWKYWFTLSQNLALFLHVDIVHIPRTLHYINIDCTCFTEYSYTKILS